MAENRKVGGSTPKNTGNMGKGRRRGVPNKTTALLKDAILKAAEQAGNDIEDKAGMVAYLKKQAQEQPVAFMSLLGKVLPMQIQGDADNPLVLKVTIGGDA